MEQEFATLPGWETVHCIGSGSSGKVYELKKKDEYGGDFHCALKVISIPATQAEYEKMQSTMSEYAMRAKLREQVEEISNEYRLMGVLRGHPNIVNCEDQMIVPHENDAGWDIYIRMELLTSLTDYVHENGITTGEVIKLGTDICSALELCEENGIIHRDIKPQNIFVSKYGVFKLGDFGVAKSTQINAARDKVGTYSYMAPEVYCGKGYTSSVDIYSLGMVLYWLLNEKRGPFLPMPPHVPTNEEIADAQLHRYRGDPVPPPKNGSPALKKLVQRACAYRPDERFANPTEMKKALQLAAVGKVLPEANPALEETVRESSVPHSQPVYMERRSAPEPQPVRPKPQLKPAPEPIKKPQPKPQPAKPQPQPKKESKSGRYTAAIVVTVLLMLLVIFVYFALSNNWIKIGSGSNSEPKVSASPEVTPYKPTSIFVSSPELTLEEGEESQLTVSLLPEPELGDDEPEIVWRSSDPSIASVDEDGNVTAIKAGTATVLVYVKGSSEVSDECTVFVKEPTVTSLIIQKLPDKTSYTIGDTLELEGLVLKAYYSNDTSEEITDPTKYSVSASMDSIGTQTVRVTYKGQTAEFTVWVGLF